MVRTASSLAREESRSGEPFPKPKAALASLSNPLVGIFAQLWCTSPPQHPCNLLDCARKKEYEALFFEVIQVLEATKKSFKSHQLEVLRKRILEVLQKNR